MKPKLGHQQPANSGAEAMGLASRSLDGEQSKSSEANKYIVRGKNIPYFHGKREQKHNQRDES